MLHNHLLSFIRSSVCHGDSPSDSLCCVHSRSGLTFHPLIIPVKILLWHLHSSIRGAAPFYLAASCGQKNCIQCVVLKALSASPPRAKHCGRKRVLSRFFEHGKHQIPLEKNSWYPACFYLPLCLKVSTISYDRGVTCCCQVCLLWQWVGSNPLCFMLRYLSLVLLFS